MGTVDWAQIPGTRWYRAGLAVAAADALARADTPGRAARALADLRFAVSNDHAGSLYPAAVPAVDLFLQVIVERPGEPRMYALSTLLDWWGCFRPEPGFEIYDDPVSGPVEVTEGIMRRVRQAAGALRRLAADFPAGEHRRPVTEVLGLLGRGWVAGDDDGTPASTGMSR